MKENAMVPAIYDSQLGDCLHSTVFLGQGHLPLYSFTKLELQIDEER